jgi:glucose uptake protein GlcU
MNGRDDVSLMNPQSTTTQTPRSMHGLGTFCAIAASSWLGAAEAPTKLVSAGFSPYAVSLCMIIGVFVARWTVPTLLNGTSYIVKDLLQKPHLLVWAVIAGALWAVANTLTIFAVRDVGLAIAFPLWNINSLVGLLWGRIFFNELKGAGVKTWTKVLGGAVAIMIGAVILSSTSIASGGASAHRVFAGIAAALGAGVMLGTMYIPYRKAYLSGLNPLSFVTIFTFGELATMSILAVTLQGGSKTLITQLQEIKPSMLWLFLGGFCWVIGDLFQQYGTKYIGISRAIPLSNTNQLWGLAWAVFVFGDFGQLSLAIRSIILSASVLMILGALAISTASAPAAEQASCVQAIVRECTRYGMDLNRVLAAHNGKEVASVTTKRRHWWDFLILVLALGLFVWIAASATRPPLPINVTYTLMLSAILLLFLGAGGWALWKYTRFE